MAIPNGYRLLTANDVGKTFGVDLESVVYFDTDIIRITDEGSYSIYFNNDNDSYISYSCGMGLDNYYCHISYNLSSNLMFYNQDEWSAGSWEISSLDLSNFTISSIDIDFGEFYNNWLYVKDISPKEQFISDMNSLGKSITDKAGASGKKSITELKDLVDNLKTTFTGQEKTVTPSKTSQVITPDSGYDGLSKVTVNVIPSSYIIPSGTLTISENGTKDVTQYASVNVNIQPTYWDGTYIEEELASGYTLTLNCESGVLNANLYLYSLDSGSTWNEFTSETMVLENVERIMFRSTGLGLFVGTTSYGSDIVQGITYSQSDLTPLTEDTTWYVWLGGGGT